MSDTPKSGQELEKRLREVQAEIEALARQHPDQRDFARWRELVAQEAELLKLIRRW